jgi:hypothetical protein
MARAASTDLNVLSAPLRNGAIQFSPNQPTAIQVNVGVLEDGTPDLLNIAAPAKARALYLQRRQIGDWYALFTVEKVEKSAVAPTQAEAIRAAADQFAVSA